MVTIIEPPPAPPPAPETGIGLKQRIFRLPQSKVRLPKRVPGYFEHPRKAAGASQQAMEPPRHGHHDPLQGAIDDELDSWARHASASNGFGDLI